MAVPDGAWRNPPEDDGRVCETCAHMDDDYGALERSGEGVCRLHTDWAGHRLCWVTYSASCDDWSE